MFASFNARALGLSATPGRALALAAEAGFDGIDLLVRDLVDSGVSPRDYRQQMDGSGLRAGAWPLPVDWRGDDDRFRRDLADLPRLADAASILGATRAGTRVMSETILARAASDHRDATRRTFDLHADRLARIEAILRRAGSRLSLEAVGVRSFQTGVGWPFITRLSDLGSLLDAIEGRGGRPGLTVDALHLHAADERPSDALRFGVDRILWVHVADLPADFAGGLDRIVDGDRGLPGESGMVDSRGLLEALDRAGFDGPVIVETLAGCRSLADLDPRDVASRARGALRRAWPA